MVEKVISLGGSIVRENLGEMDELASALEKGGQKVVVVGAGDLSRHIDAVSSATKGEKDMVGIQATRLNARTLQVAMNAYPSIPEEPDELLEAVESGKNVVMGGMVPGYSTDAVAATAAELLDAELYIATDVDGVYTSPPEEEGAEKLERVTVEELEEILGDDREPGSYELIDRTAREMIGRSGIKTRIFRGTVENLENPEACGTRIVAG